MKKFLINLVLFTAICIGTIIMISSFRDPSHDVNTNYMAAIIDKHARLDSLTSNRLILVGGSNIVFGIDSKTMEKKTGKNVVNLGLHGGLGSKFILNEIEENVRENDLILLNLEYSLYDDSYAPYNDLIAFTQKIYPASREYYQLSPLEKLDIYCDNFVKRFTEEQQILSRDYPYTRRAFNKYGDDTLHLNQKGLKSLSGSMAMSKVRLNLIIKRLQELNLTCAKRNATLVLLYPDYARSEFKLNYRVIKDLEYQINREIKFLRVINKPETFVFNDDMFFDTVYHLNSKGRQLRTELLLNILNRQGLVHFLNNR